MSAEHPQFHERAHSIDPDRYSAEWYAGWPTVHPEDFCSRCHKRNPNWVAPQYIWAVVVSALPPLQRSILCPDCVIEVYQALTGFEQCWSVMPYADQQFTD